MSEQWESIQGNAAGRQVVAIGTTKALRNVCSVGGPKRDDRARLIAAAPDLLAALRDLTLWCQGYESTIGNPLAVGHIALANAAIAKAEGRT